MSRLNKERQKALEPKRINTAKSKISALGYKILYEDNTTIQFNHKGEIVTYHAYSGWATGKTIKDGRGLQNLLKQLENQSL